MRTELHLPLAAAAALSLALAGCGDDQVCGPGDIAPTGLTATVGADTVGYGNFWSSPNNDCPRDGHPTALTVEGRSADNYVFTFCLPRPDEIGDAPIPLDDAEQVELNGTSGETADGCIFTYDRSVAATGTIEFIGYCDEGLSAEGYAIRVAGTVGGTLTCTGTDAGTTMEPVTIELAGEVAVEAINL